MGGLPLIDIQQCAGGPQLIGRNHENRLSNPTLNI
jgi:hypothetical protein